MRCQSLWNFKDLLQAFGLLKKHGNWNYRKNKPRPGDRVAIYFWMGER
jgi:hypothetical protein